MYRELVDYCRVTCFAFSQACGRDSDIRGEGSGISCLVTRSSAENDDVDLARIVCGGGRGARNGGDEEGSSALCNDGVRRVQ